MQNEARVRAALAEKRSESDTSPAPALAERISAAVLAVPGVAALHGGMFGEVGTYLPGRRVLGIRVESPAIGTQPAVQVVQVHLVAFFGVSVSEIAARVRAAGITVVGPCAVDVHIEDIRPLPSAGSAAGFELDHTKDTP